MANFFGNIIPHVQVNNNADDVTVVPVSSFIQVPFFLTKLTIAYTASDYSADDLIVQFGFSTEIDGSNPVYFTGAYKTEFNINKQQISLVFEEYSLFIPSTIQSIVIRTNTKTGNTVSFRISALLIPSNHPIVPTIKTFFGNVSVTGSNTYTITSLPTSLYKRKSVYWSIPELGTGTIGILGIYEDISTDITSKINLNEIFSNSVSISGNLSLITVSVSPATTVGYWVTYTEVS